MAARPALLHDRGMNLTIDRHIYLAALIVEAANGDHGAFRKLHTLTHDFLYHTALRLLRSPGLAEDVLQEAYLSIWLHAASFRPGQGSPMTWLIAIVRNRAFSALRSHRGGIASLMSEEDPALLAEVEHDDGADPDAQAFGALGRTRLEQALARLEPAQRQSIALVFNHELTHAEMARHLGVPLGTAKSWVRRALERLRISLEQADATGAPKPVPVPMPPPERHAKPIAVSAAARPARTRRPAEAWRQGAANVRPAAGRRMCADGLP